MAYPITCLVCGKQGQHGDTAKGWRLAPNRVGGYVCGPECDGVIAAYDKRIKDAAKAAGNAKHKKKA